MKIEENFGPVFEQGITIPRNVVLPEEFIQAFSFMGLAELKITLAAIIQFMRIGGAEPITFSEFMTLTGLNSKASIQAGIDAAMKRGILTRFEVIGYRGHKSYVYEIQTNAFSENSIGTESVPIKPLVKLSVDVKDTNDIKTLTNLTTVNYEKANEIKMQLRKAGVFPNTANSLVSKFNPNTIRALLEIYPKAQMLGLADGVGWLVRAIQNRWDIEEIIAEMNSREAAQKLAEDNHAELPADLTEKIIGFGWVGSLKEIADIYSTKPEFVISWASYVAENTQKYQNPAGIFRKGIRDSAPPPTSKAAKKNSDYSWAVLTNPENEHILEERQRLAREQWFQDKKSIPTTILTAWELTYEAVCEMTQNAYFDHYKKGLIPCRYEQEPETLYIAVEERKGCHWLTENMKYKFQDAFIQQYQSTVLIFFEFNPYPNEEENYGTK